MSLSSRANSQAVIPLNDMAADIKQTFLSTIGYRYKKREYVFYTVKWSGNNIYFVARRNDDVVISIKRNSIVGFFSLFWP